MSNYKTTPIIFRFLWWKHNCDTNERDILHAKNHNKVAGGGKYEENQTKRGSNMKTVQVTYVPRALLYMRDKVFVTIFVPSFCNGISKRKFHEGIAVFLFSNCLMVR